MGRFLPADVGPGLIILVDALVSADRPGIASIAVAWSIVSITRIQRA
jgi:hypothetical protein